MAGSDGLFEIIVGTYEEYLLGYKLIKTDKKYELHHTIASHSHKASLRSVTSHNKFLASGGADECIQLYDLITRKECGLLMHHSGAITVIVLYSWLGPQLAIIIFEVLNGWFGPQRYMTKLEDFYFSACIYSVCLTGFGRLPVIRGFYWTVTSLCFTPDGHYLISGSEDGSIAMFAVGSWVLDKVWSKAHKGKAVNHVAIHPSGKMALSIGNDCTLRTWNLVKGRCAYIVNISSKCKRPEVIKWSLCGEYFGLVNESNIDIYCVASASIMRSIQLKHKISSIQFIMVNKVCLGDSSGTITCYDFLSGEEVWVIPAKEEARIKCLDFYENWLVSTNSNGIINVYNVSEGQTPFIITSQETSCRITCMTISHITSDDKSKIQVKKKKRKNIYKTRIENDGIKTRKIITANDAKNLHCYPADQKWHVQHI